MKNNIINFELKKKVYMLRKKTDFNFKTLNLENILKDVILFKKHTKIVQKSELLFSKMIQNKQNYTKCIDFQQNFVDEFKKMG